jgi:hypothetical protein
MVYNKNDLVYCTDGNEIYYGKIIKFDSESVKPYRIRLLEKIDLNLVKDGEIKKHEIYDEQFGWFLYCNDNIASIITIAKQVLITKYENIIDKANITIKNINNNFDEVFCKHFEM